VQENLLPRPASGDTTVADAPIAPARTSRIQTFASLRHRNYRLLWSSSIFSSSGQWIQQTTVGWLTYDVTGSAFLLGAINGFRSLPLLLLGPMGGVAADRVDRKRLMLFTQVFLVILTAIFATIVITGNAHFWNILVFTLLTGVAWAFMMPVRQSLVPNLVPREDIANAIALNSAGVNITRIVGPSLAGIMIAVISIGGNFYIQSLAYVGVSLMVLMIHVPPLTRARQDVSALKNLSEGAQYVWGRPSLRAQLSLGLIPPILCLPYTSMMPVFAQDVLHVGPEKFGLMMAVPGIGALLGTLTIATLGNVQRKGVILFLSLSGVGLSLIAFSLSRSFPLSLFLLMFVGACQMTYFTTNQTLIQLMTPDEFRGRVMGIFMLNQGLMPLGSLFAGALAEFAGAPFAIALMGASALVISATALLFMPSVRRL
jgi:MFS family permease